MLERVYLVWDGLDDKPEMNTDEDKLWICRVNSTRKFQPVRD
ncbi:hypothetical protein [Paenibacillus hamazuiensis]|nr:hypothetical protein [Paenibacillus hamazuiensis]